VVSQTRPCSKKDPEFELRDSGPFEKNRYCDIVVEYAKACADDLLVRITAHNRGPEAAPIRLLPTIWFRNTWSWEKDVAKPSLAKGPGAMNAAAIALDHPQLGKHWLYAQEPAELLFTENETNTQRLYGYAGPQYAKDSINDYIVGGKPDAVNPAHSGTRASAHYRHAVPAGGSVTVKLRLTNQLCPASKDPLGNEFD